MSARSSAQWLWTTRSTRGRSSSTWRLPQSSTVATSHSEWTAGRSNLINLLQRLEALTRWWLINYKMATNKLQQVVSRVNSRLPSCRIRPLILSNSPARHLACSCQTDKLFRNQHMLQQLHQLSLSQLLIILLKLPLGLTLGMIAQILGKGTQHSSPKRSTRGSVGMKITWTWRSFFRMSKNLPNKQVTYNTRALWKRVCNRTRMTFNKLTSIIRIRFCSSRMKSPP